MRNVVHRPSEAIRRLKLDLLSLGQEVNQSTWQSVKSPDATWELLNPMLRFPIPLDVDVLEREVKPNLPWAKDHFQERVGGLPMNPGEQYKNWPFYKKTQYSDSTHRKKEKFSHTYMERFWPKKAWDPDSRPMNGQHIGIRYAWGDFQDVINLIRNDPSTRQAYLPIWFPEDTGVVHGERVPCTLGYHFIIRNGFMHINYYIRSCDYLRHLRDDIYLACCLVYHIIKETQLEDVYPGIFSMHITSLHVFKNEVGLLKLEKY